MFITFEGGDCAGKSTQIHLLADHLRALGKRVVVTREPGGTQLGEAIRGVLMADHGHPMPAMSELLLMFAARAAHLEQVIEPALADGAWVLCDRFTDSSYAYQGYARGLGSEAVETLETLVQGERRPDLVLVLDISGQERERRQALRNDANRFDREDWRFHARARNAFLSRAQPGPYEIVFGDEDFDLVAQAVRKAVAHLTKAPASTPTISPTLS